MLQGLARHVTPDIRHPLKVIHNEKRLNCASEYMKLDFKVVLFTDECRAPLDGHDGWSKVGSPMEAPVPTNVEVACFGLGSLVMSWLVKFLKV